MNMIAPVPVTKLEISSGTPLCDALLALNNGHAEELSWLERERLQDLVAQAFYARRIGNLDAFMIALDQDGQYDSPNFLWFRSRYARFGYVDRIVVAASARGMGCARRLYADLFDRAAEAGYDRIVCEVNQQPRNDFGPCTIPLILRRPFKRIGMRAHSPAQLQEQPNTMRIWRTPCGLR